MRLWSTRAGIAAVILVSVAGMAIAFRMGRAQASGIPQTGTMSYSGTLLNFGQPDSDDHTIVLRLWAGGSVACTTTPAGTTRLVNGHFTIPLDDSCVTIVHQNRSVLVEVVVDGNSLGQSPLGAVPYAVEADTASAAAPGSALASIVPAGTVIAYAGVVAGSGNVAPPPGWLLCDGAAVSRTTYANLFAAIGTTAGPGDGSTTFNLPDYQGYFLRGVDHGKHRDPDAATRTAQVAGGGAGDTVSTVESANLGSHAHGVNDPGHNHGGGTSGIINNGNADSFFDWNPTGSGTTGRAVAYNVEHSWSNSFMGHQHGIPVGGTNISIQSAGGSETRPANVSVNYLVRY